MSNYHWCETCGTARATFVDTSGRVDLYVCDDCAYAELARSMLTNDQGEIPWPTWTVRP